MDNPKHPAPLKQTAGVTGTTRNIDLPFPAAGAGQTRVEVDTFANDVIVCKTTIPADAKPQAAGRGSALFQAIYIPGPDGQQQPMREACLSASPGDFASPLAAWAHGKSMSIELSYSIGIGGQYPYAVVQPGQVVYFNIRNLDAVAGKDCRMAVILGRPTGA